MLKCLCKKVVLIRFLVALLFVFVTFEFIQSYNHKIIRAFKDVNSKYYSGYKNDGSVLQVVTKNMNEFIFRKNVSLNDDDVPLADDLAMPSCPKTFAELFNNSSTKNNLWKRNKQCKCSRFRQFRRIIY